MQHQAVVVNRLGLQPFAALWVSNDCKDSMRETRNSIVAVLTNGSPGSQSRVPRRLRDPLVSAWRLLS
jgi:hypothetical protein